MIFKCFNCGRVSFNSSCHACGSVDPLQYVPLEIEYYEEFQYRKQGVIKDILYKKKAEQALHEKLDSVFEKYKQFEYPYFVNFIHLSGFDTADSHLAVNSSELKLFHNVLIQLGFSELKELPQLTIKLIRSTAFRFEYSDFVRRTAHHINNTLSHSLTSWIEESGNNYLTTLPMFIYQLWKEELLVGQVRYNLSAPPLILRDEWLRIMKLCDQIHAQIQVRRFRLTLENFDPSEFITIFALDSMTGYEFEDFLRKMLTSIGYAVEVTKRSQDQGADLFAEKFGKRIVIQAKNYADNVGNAAVQQVLAAKAFYGCDEAMVMTNSVFTASARELAESTGVRLVGRDEIQKYLDEYNRRIMELGEEGQFPEGTSDNWGTA